MKKEEIITKLVKIWHEVIGSDAHTDNDCHFRINTHWHYHGKLEYELEHRGSIIYCGENGIKRYNKLEDAQDALINLLTKGINEQLEFLEENDLILEKDLIRCRSKLDKI